MFSVGSTIINVLWIILIVVVSVLATFLLLSLVFKLTSFLSLRFRPDTVQKGGLVKKKFFICRDGYQLNWMGEINPQGQKILLGIHDLGMSSQDFIGFRDYCHKTDPLISVVSYDQRNFGKTTIQTKRNAGSMIVDLQDIIIDLKEKYPQQEIILIGEGLGYYVGTYVAGKQPQVSKIIGIGLRNHEPYQQKLSTKMTILSGILFSPYQLINIRGEGHDLSSNPEFVKKIDNHLFEKGQISVKEYFQHQQLIRQSVRKLSRLNQPVLVLQGQNDIYVNLAKTKKMLDKSITSKFEIKYFAQKKHFLLNETNNQEVYQTMIQWAKNETFTV